MNEKQMITVALRSGNPIIFPDKESARKVLGKDTITWEFAYIDFEKNGKKIYVLNGEPTLALTPEEKEKALKLERIPQIKTTLKRIDHATGSRAIRAVLLQLAGKAKIKGVDVDKLREFENEAERLRAELADLSAQKEE